jgi:protein SCO1
MLLPGMCQSSLIHHPPPLKVMNKRYFSIAVLLIVVLLFAVPIFFRPEAPAPGAPGMTLLPPRAPLAAFELRDQHDQVFDVARLRGKWSLLFFGYIRCPDICPMTLGTLKQVHQLLGDKNTNIQYVFVSVDPERDTPALLGDYTGYFHADFLGVSGPTSELDKLTKALGVYYRPGKSAAGGYQVDHSAAVFLVDPQARLRGLFSAPQNAQNMAANLSRLEIP